MKRITFIIIATLLFVFNKGKAQSGTIRHTHFDPPMTLLGQLNSDTLTMDFNQDDIADLGICWLGYPWTPYIVPVHTNCDYLIHDVGDTSSMSSPNLQWQHNNGYISFEDEYEWCVRLKKGNDYYYGWAYTGAFSEPNPGMPHNKIYIAIYDLAYCTIPNYPLKWGQTSIQLDIEENSVISILSLYPNPTKDIVTLISQHIKLAEVYNIFGQRVATAMGHERLILNLSGQPSGVYFVNVTDEEGRKCVRKVVKE